MVNICLLCVFFGFGVGRHTVSHIVEVKGQFVGVCFCYVSHKDLTQAVSLDVDLLFLCV